MRQFVKRFLFGGFKLGPGERTDADVERADTGFEKGVKEVVGHHCVIIRCVGSFDARGFMKVLTTP